MKVLVRSAISECEMDAAPKTPVRQIFEMMCKNLLIFEKWYFGLSYRDSDNCKVWVDGSKKTIKDLKNVIQKLHFEIKYYPEDVGEELIEKSTIELFFAQVKSAVHHEDIYCPADTCVLLASYVLQAKHGDYENEIERQKVIEVRRLIPDRILKQHEMDSSAWEENILNMWRKHRNLDEEDAMLEYLKLVQNLEMYGVNYFDIRNRKGSKLLLGVNALGLDIYKPEDKLNPQISFPWSEIKNLKFRDRKFVIKPTDKSAQDFIFFTNDAKISKYILNLGIGNHVLYVKRRKPEDQEITSMKIKAKELRKAREVQKSKLTKERAAREEVERRENEYKMLIESMKKEMEQNEANLLEAQNTIRRLQEQLDELQRAKEELEKQQKELREMMERLEQSKNLEEAEKRALEEEIRAKQLEVQRIQEEVELKDAETKRLQDEVDEARRREEEIQRLEEEKRQRELEEAVKKEDEGELEAIPEGASTDLPELVTVNDQLREQLKILQDQLSETRNTNLESDLDKIHMVNLRQGRDKYKTLAEIRRGNTVRRVEMFENM